MNAQQTIAAIESGKYAEIFTTLYGEENVKAQEARYVGVVNEFAKLFGADREISLFSVAGRSEISGNHTDHNCGRVLAASINLDIIAAASPRDDMHISIKSEGFPIDEVDITNPTVDESLYYTSKSIISGMCSGFLKYGHKVGGYDAYTTSNVFKGSGLSSSAAFEDMVGLILNGYYNEGSVDNAEIARIAQYSENVFFGKPSGLMDQTACAVGGFVAIDFKNPSDPIIEKLPFDLTAAGYSLCIVNTGGNHADLNEDYASVPAEMKKVAAYFGKNVLREVTLDEILSNIPKLRELAGDRAIMRAIHFENENERVSAQTEALRNGDIDGFFAGVLASGNSSFKYLQNVYTVKNVSEQGLSLALCVADNALKGKKAAYRVHGGGFAGTIQAFVANEDVPAFKSALDAAFGEGAVTILKVRPYGAIRIQ
ncbi:MAG: galactokinase [Clostridiales bacterium]|nr:galactokinase [Clostridiales bacterium]